MDLKMGEPEPESTILESRRWRWRLIAVLLIVGALLRFYGLGSKSLWVDEANAVAQSETLERLMDYCIRGHEPPLRLMLVWALQKAPNGDWAIRLPAAIIGTLTVLVMLWLGERLWDFRTGVVAAILVLLSPWHLYHSQDARYYGVILFLGLVAFGLMARIIQNPRPLWRWALVAAVCALNLYMSYLGVFTVLPVVIGLIAYTVWSWFGGQDRDRRLHFLRGLAVAGLVGFLLMLPWLFVLFGTIGRYTGAVATPQSDVPRINLYPTRLDWPYFHTLLMLLGLGHPIVQWVLAALFALGLVRASWERPWMGLFAALWFLLPWAIILATAMKYFLPPRYLFHYLGLYLLLTAAGITLIWGAIEQALARVRSDSVRKTMRAIAGVLAAIAALYALAAYAREDWNYLHTEKQAWRQVARYLNQHVQATEPVVTGGLWASVALRHYKDEFRFGIQLYPEATTAPQMIRAMKLHPNARAWYVVYGPRFPEATAFLNAQFELVAVFPGIDGTIEIYRSKPR